MIIGINSGHTLPNGGSQGAVGLINESTENRNVSKVLSKVLTKAGHTVVNCTNDFALNANDNLRQIVTMANAQPLDLFISIHFNSGGGKGTEVYTYNGKNSSVCNQAENIAKNISKLGFVNRGVKDGSSFYVLKNTKTPAMLVECCFVDSQSDVSLYKSISPSKIALAIAKAIDTSISDTESNGFEDIKGHYAEKHITKLKEYGIINGDGSGNFNPEAYITRGDVAIMIASTLTALGK